MVMARGVPTDGVWDAPGLTGAGPSGLSAPNGMMPSWSLGRSFSAKESHSDETGACAVDDGVDAVEVIRFRPEQRQEVVSVLDEGL